MLEQDKILSLMTKHFPRWMDIRKRVKTSNGGKYLQSLAYEVADIQTAIDEYKKDFFLINYRDKYDDIPYYVYYITVGDIDTSDFVLISPNGLSEASSVEEFYNTDNKYFYEDNKIFFRKENVDETSAQVKYALDEIEYTSIISKLFVWNIYDEFAAFVGLKRFTNEDNESLTNRILNVFKCIPNSTEEGLKNAIINDLLEPINEAYPNLSYDEIRNKIIIERPTSENLELKYDEFTTILDKLAEINADVYRMKIWDEDIWQFKLSGIDYLPHVWDHILAAYDNGIGFKDDLKPEIIEHIDETNATAKISVYKQDFDVIQEYLSGHSIKKNIKLRLLKYNDDLKATDVEYTIAASKPVDITNRLDDISLSVTDGTKNTSISLSDIFELTEDDELYLNNVTQSFVKCHKDYIYEEVPVPDPDPDPNPEPTEPTDPDKPTEPTNPTDPTNPDQGETGGNTGEETGGDTGSETGDNKDNTGDKEEEKPPKTELVVKEIIRTYSIVRITLDNKTVADKIKAARIDSNKAVYSIICSDNDFHFDPIFVYRNENEYRYDITNSHSGAFEYCYLTQKSEIIHYSYNKVKTYTKITNDVEMANNFSPVMQFEDQYIYVITNYKNCTAAFQNNLTDTFIGSWSFGNSLLSITSSIDYDNVESTSYTFNADITTNSPRITFSDMFTENNISQYLTADDGSSINPADFTPRNLSRYEISSLISDDASKEDINYSKTYLSNADLANDTVSTNKYVRSVRATNITSEYIKLPHVKIDNILYIGSNMNWRLGNPVTNTVRYTLQAEKGLIIFDSAPSTDLYIVYTIYVPESVSIPLNELYKLAEYNRQAYKKIYDSTISGITDGYVYTVENVDDSDLYNIIVTDYPTYFIPAIIDNTVVFNKVPENALSIKYGYYYFGEQEYYLLADKTPTSEENISNVKFENTRSNGSEIILNKYNENYIKNSHMQLNTISNTYAIDLIKYADKIINNKLGAISTCDNFYKWKSFGVDLSLEKYGIYNNIGIRLISNMPNGYAYYDITVDKDSETSKEYYISLYLSGKLNAYVAKETTYDGMRFRRSLTAEIVKKLDTLEIDNRVSTVFTQEPGYNYYLIITAESQNKNYINIFDDIMMYENTDKLDINAQKNIDILGYSIKEKVTDNNYNNRIYFDSNKYTDKNNVDIDQYGYIINSCNIDWDMTKLFEYKNADDFKRYLSVRSKVNIDEHGNYLYTTSDGVGRIVTEPITINNYRLIKNLIIEINDMPFESLTGFQTRLLVSQTEDGIYEDTGTIAYKNTDSFSGDLLTGNFVKLSIVVPVNKYIGSIAMYAEYKTTETEQPIGAIKPNGSITSAILDTYYMTDYIIDKINMECECPLSSFRIKIRSYKDNNIWTDWKDIVIDSNGNVTTTVKFENTRYFQAIVEVLQNDTRVKINYIDVRRSDNDSE